MDGHGQTFRKLMQTPLAARDEVEAAPPLPLHTWPAPVYIAPAAPSPQVAEAVTTPPSTVRSARPTPYSRAPQRSSGPRATPADVLGLEQALYVAVGGLLAGGTSLVIALGAFLWMRAPAPIQHVVEDVRVAEAVAPVPEVEALVEHAPAEGPEPVVTVTAPPVAPVPQEPVTRPSPVPAATPVPVTEPAVEAAPEASEQRRGLFRRRRRDK